jgi:hypothetical protein
MLSAAVMAIAVGTTGTAIYRTAMIARALARADARRGDAPGDANDRAG